MKNLDLRAASFARVSGYALAVCVASNLFFPGWAWAQGKAGKPSQATEEQTTTDFGSGAIRERRPVGLALQYTPLSDFVLEYGAAAHFNHGRFMQYGVSFLMGSEDLKNKVSDSQTDVPKFTLEGFAAEGYARLHPMRGTFSFKAGIGYRQAKAKYRIESKTSDLFIEGSLDIQSVVVPVFVGNHWSFDNGIVFGCDWIGAYIPLSGSSKSTLESNAQGTAENRTALLETNKDIADLGDDLAKRVSLTLLVASFGYQF